ncbi:MAG: mandelate racemase/muconate lactonizing enzyme family protein [Actinomycetota bacterium]|nr:mandelate racemase/muconate lactonizing enzyme family protein [Actinomycetota bacterium]
MKITAVRLDRLRYPLDPPFHAAWDPEPRRHFDVTVVRVETDDGVVGVGSGDTMAGFEAFEHLFVGTDPLQLARQARVIETVNFHAGRFWPLEAALWDIAGQVAGLPVATLLGGTATRLPAYASTGQLATSQQRIESAHQAAAEGFRAMKIRIARADLDGGVSAVRGVREALGDDFAVLVDLNQSWRMAGDVEPALDVKAVARTVARLEELGVVWVEEPLPYADVAGLAQLRRSTRLLVSGGEMLATFEDALALLERDALDVYQMDCMLSLGIGGCRTFAELARRRHRQFTPHTWTNGIGVLANLHLAAGIGGGPFFELPYDPPGWTPRRRDFMLAEPTRVDPDGWVSLPDAPGLGVRLDEEEIDRWRLT